LQLEIDAVAGHSRPKDGVASLAYVPGHWRLWEQARPKACRLAKASSTAKIKP
jgi:hypothetical protein